MKFRWWAAALLVAALLPLSLALAEHPKWAPMAPQPAKKSSHTSHAGRYYRGRSTAHVRASSCAGARRRILPPLRARLRRNRKRIERRPASDLSASAYQPLGRAYRV